MEIRCENSAVFYDRGETARFLSARHCGRERVMSMCPSGLAGRAFDRGSVRPIFSMTRSGALLELSRYF